MIYALIGCLIIIGFLGYKLSKKQVLDTQVLEDYQNKKSVLEVQIGVQEVKIEKNERELETLQEQTEYEKYKLTECRKDLQAALDVYQDITDNKLKEINASMEEQRQKRQEELDQQFKDKAALYEKDLQKVKTAWEQEITSLAERLDNTKAETESIAMEYWAKANYNKKKFEGIISVLAQYEKEQQEKLFYTIQLPEEYYEDIEFLLTTVAAKVAHPDIISKLVWTEYVKPNLENTFKRIEIKSEPGIYKLTSLENGKCYVGKSTDVKRRITDHFKSVVGITSIADQAVHHAIRKEGFWNWMIEIITYCDKEQLPELEKYYIEFFKAQDYGYNKNGGG